MFDPGDSEKVWCSTFVSDLNQLKAIVTGVIVTGVFVDIYIYIYIVISSWRSQLQQWVGIKPKSFIPYLVNFLQDTYEVISRVLNAVKAVKDMPCSDLSCSLLMWGLHLVWHLSPCIDEVLLFYLCHITRRIAIVISGIWDLYDTLSIRVSSEGSPYQIIVHQHDYCLVSTGGTPRRQFGFLFFFHCHCLPNTLLAMTSCKAVLLFLGSNHHMYSLIMFAFFKALGYLHQNGLLPFKLNFQMEQVFLMLVAVIYELVQDGIPSYINKRDSLAILTCYFSSLDLEDKVKVYREGNVTTWSVNILNDDVAKFVRRNHGVKEGMWEWCEQLFNYKEEEDEAMWWMILVMFSL